MKRIYDMVCTCKGSSLQMQLLLLLMLFTGMSASAQHISIQGNVYGGGNAGNTGGNTSVTVRGGDIDGNVFGGARQADVGGSAFVNIDGAHATSYILINQVYGGNDISGTIGTASEVPDALTLKGENNITNEWNAFVRVSSKEHVTTTGTEGNETTTAAVYIGELFGGGNGDYEYIPEENGEHHIKDKEGNIIASAPVSESDFTPPVLDRTYLEIVGGSIIWAFGGGNKVTVNEQAVICVDNPSDVVFSIKNKGVDLLLDNARVERMGVNPGYSNATSDAFQIGSFFGGNNLAAMAICPVWNLKNGKIRNLYSGGNRGAMTSPIGLLMEIPATSKIKVDNLYGGCRMADVHPMNGNEDVDWSMIQLPSTSQWHFPAGFSARVVVLGGDINNIYGGNDISGRTYGGNAIGIYTSIRGSVYGGGNGSYPYTDNVNLANHKTYGDLYYVPGSSSVDALNDFRPNAEQVSIRVRGKDAAHPVVIGGALYVGGNSATLKARPGKNPKVELKIGSHVYADSVFLGNNGANMVANIASGDVLQLMNNTTLSGDGTKFNSIELENDNVFAKYMEGCAMTIPPTVKFDGDDDVDETSYEDYTTYFGSFFCGGNVGSFINPGKITIPFTRNVIIYDKLVGGCNNAYVAAKTGVNAAYLGGVLGDPDDDGNKLEFNLSGLKIQPMRWAVKRDNDYNKVLDEDDNVQFLLKDANADEGYIGHRYLEWNTVDSRDYNSVTKTYKEVAPITEGGNVDAGEDDEYRRFVGGNIYGGCCTSGVVNGNVIVNINSTIVDRSVVFDIVEKDDETGENMLYGNDTYHITADGRRTGVILDYQGMDVLGAALNVFGGGKGQDTEIWGSTTVNLNSGYVFQIFGGSEEGAIGKRQNNTKDAYGRYTYTYDTKYSTYVNLSGSIAGQSIAAYPGDDMAQAEFLYGGGFEGAIAGNTHINLGNGRIFNSFAGSCNADILGHTETVIGANGGFPYVRDHLYGGNDLGGRILGNGGEEINFSGRVRSDAVRSKVYNQYMLKASSYMEYLQGHVKKIFGGCYGVYDYTDPLYGNYFYATGATDKPEGKQTGQARPGNSKPFLGNAFVNFRPSVNPSNSVDQIYGAGQGYFGEKEENLMQESSYILIDVPQSMQNFQNTEVFGAGECGGVGMGVSKDIAAAAKTAYKASAVIDLVSGHLNAVYGGSYQEGITRRTVVNVPAGSTFHGNKLFGGAYGRIDVTTTKDDQNNDVTVETPRIDVACDVYEAIVNYNSADAMIDGAIYGGNNACRRTLYGKININVPVKGGTHWTGLANVYGAGYGVNTWSQYTEVNLNSGAQVQEVYGGGENGQVINKESVAKWKVANTALFTDLEDYTDPGLADGTPASSNQLYTVDNQRPKYYNTNVHINQGATVARYCYGGGLGHRNISYSGNVLGTTYIDLLGGTVKFDLYAAGTSGSVKDSLGVKNGFIASSTAYIEGGTARNVYGGGWEGSVGQHDGDITTSFANDIDGETHVVIGKLNGTSFTDGIPAIERNAYGGGEGGAVFGTANITLNKGYIGYRYFSTAPDDAETYPVIADGGGYFQEKIDDDTNANERNTLYRSGSIYGGGYIDNSSVDVSNVKMYGGHVRNSLFGGGEIAAIGRGVIHASGEDNSVRQLQGIYRAGKTHVTLYGGHVHRNVFGGGRGYDYKDNFGNLYSEGYVFGQTEVNIFGGEVGTTKEVALGNGNVFGGGDIGYVYSAYEKNGGVCAGLKDGVRYDDQWEGFYYMKEGGSFVNGVYTGGNWVMDGEEYVLTEDCKVLVEPHCLVTADGGVDIDTPNANGVLQSVHYSKGDYVPTTALNTLGYKKDDTKWTSLDPTGIIIHNAVFAGGNTSSGSSRAYANATSVFGNVTASIHDVYHRDLITLGSEHTGGLYGDGNLTFVDGYRGLNITNYGTDYYSFPDNEKEITLDKYYDLEQRERDYYELRYICIKQCTDKDGTTYHPASNNSKASTLNSDDLLTLFVTYDDNNHPVSIKDGDTDIILINPTTYERTINPAYWELNGVCTIYAGRIMNTIQRADFCGVFGSRMVMQGAPDRVPEVVDYTNYTINRVREVSLNQQHSVIPGDLTKNGSDEYDFTDLKKAVHGNYFGIYNVVNFLGALTSDVHFRENEDKRRTDNVSNDIYSTEGGESYYEWKATHVKDRTRNNGSSFNKVALASGVYLELTTEKSRGSEIDEKDWGYVTGVIELDLINVQTGIGGGFVYAKNQHGKQTYSPQKHATLTALNADAITQKDYTYSTTDLKEWETSGNFVHSTQTIIDDCYNVSGKYQGDDAVPAHYWYVQGQVYVYDQYISAYTGAPNAYSETVDIPLTITAASHGTMKLINVKPNKYAYWKSTGVKLEQGQKMVINDVTYEPNTPISYWDWYLLSKSEQNLFEDETYVSIAECRIGETTYPAGTVLLPGDYTSWKSSHPQVLHVEKNQNVAFEEVFRPSNNLGHDTGYILTYKVNNPTEWNTWYTSATAQEKNQTGGDGYENGPTYRLTSGTSQVLGQREYEEGNLISADVYNTYQDIDNNYHFAIPTGQATFERAWLVTKQIDITSGGVTTHLNPGTAVSKTKAATLDQNSVAEAFICTSTIQLSQTDFIYLNSRMTAAEKITYMTQYPTLASIIDECVVPAYYCLSDGLYGGDYYESGKNYRGLTAWCSMSPTDREKFTFNYDALDLLIDKNYGGTEGEKYQYDGPTAEAAAANAAGYSQTQALDYSATYYGNGMALPNNATVTVTRYDAEQGKNITTSTNQIQTNDDLSRAAFETIPNEQRYFAPITVSSPGTYYVVNTPLLVGNSPYAVGKTIPKEVYDDLDTSDKNNVTTLTFASTGTYYYCRESYTKGVAVTAAAGVTGSAPTPSGTDVPVGLVITSDNYGSLPNLQKEFTIHGIAPTETSTLFVSRNSDIFDLSTEKIITVIYEYDYEESDGSNNVTPVSERHVVNIHVQFKSGIPTVEDIRSPQIVIPGDFIGLRDPNVTPGAYEVTGGGWELFETEEDAESHINGIEYTPRSDALYWYQNGYYLAYYAKTFLGKTYSNHVPVTVANYHDLKKVMDDQEHHYFIDNPGVKRAPKIYINDYTSSSQNGLDLLKGLIDLSYNKAAANTAYGALDTPNSIIGGNNLDIILRTNISHTDAWTPIAYEEGECFSGRLHGDGYYVEGINNSLFNHLCGSVYNLGVKGSFTGAGIAEQGDGYVENCWVSTSSTAVKTAKPVLGTPDMTNDTRPYRIVNCYYEENEDATNKYTNHSSTYGIPTRMDHHDFHDGKVAYNLNGFYLYKRYCDHEVTTGEITYPYYTINKTDNTLVLQDGNNGTKLGHYANNPGICSTGHTLAYNTVGYVEDRFADGDFIYANGSVPENTEERAYTNPSTKVTSYYPIWPDDYIYFGQMLTYGWYPQRPHEEVPSRIYKSYDRLVLSDMSNRVYRAPAYFGSKTMDVAHFNPNVNLVAYSKAKDANDTNLHPAYPGMTAIDFAGHQDMAYDRGKSGNYFYPPLLDDAGIVSIVNRDESKNLLIYAPSAEANATTNAVLTNLDVFPEPAYSEYYSNDKYRRVAAAPTSSVTGHLVLSTLRSASDHLLVDENDFNCPIQYTMGDGYRMWHQRSPLPNQYVTQESGKTKGWEDICLPFTAELVTTPVKGEITHFYQGYNADGSSNTFGHEYWLREYNGIDNSASNGDELAAKFNSPDAAGDDKVYYNTYLWDNYYSKNNYDDRNSDDFQKTYYQPGGNGIVHTYTRYPLFQAGTPYLIGFPGKTYYEFDLSGYFGKYEEMNTINDASITKPDAQFISFVSDAGVTIKVSDDELDTGVEHNNYVYYGTYTSKPLAEGDFQLNGDGDKYVKQAAGSKTKPFHPYFVKKPGSGTRTMVDQTNSIIIMEDSAKLKGTTGITNLYEDDLLLVKGGKKKIMVESQLHYTSDVRIVTPAGVTLTSYSIQPSEYVETRVETGGVYIVYADNGKYVKKVIVR